MVIFYHRLNTLEQPNDPVEVNKEQTAVITIGTSTRESFLGKSDRVGRTFLDKEIGLSDEIDNVGGIHRIAQCS